MEYAQHRRARTKKNQANEIVRSVREEQAEYIITYHGEAVAVLLPIERAWIQEGEQGALEAAQPGPETLNDLAALRADIDRSWRRKKTGAQLVREGRR